jgi:sec-independent protein translocase protein TatA
MGGLGAWEIGMIALVVIVLFGTRKLPELGSGLGKAISNFKRSYKEGSEIDVTSSSTEQKPKDDSK